MMFFFLRVGAENRRIRAVGPHDALRPRYFLPNPPPVAWDSSRFAIAVCAA